MKTKSKQVSEEKITGNELEVLQFVKVTSLRHVKFNQILKEIYCDEDDHS